SALKVVRPTSLSSEVMSSTALSTTDPPSPPWPPSGPPLGTYLSLRNDSPPSPPLPACTVMSSTSRKAKRAPALTNGAVPSRGPRPQLPTPSRAAIAPHASAGGRPQRVGVD